MFTGQGSAEAYERLAELTNAANHAARLGHDWLKCQRAIRDLMTDLALNEPADSPLIALLSEYKAFFQREGASVRDSASKLSSECIALNERIQNGVYNHEEH